jgi:hypothetical protein
MEIIMLFNKKSPFSLKLRPLIFFTLTSLVVSQASYADKQQLSANPQLSVVIDGGYVGSSRPSDEYFVPGFQLGEEAELASSGFQINEAELNVQSNIDPYWFGNLTIGMHQHGGHTEFDIEEAFIRTLALPEGLSLIAGRFFSGIGYLNHHHRHQWDFVDAPLVYRALFNNQYRDDGVQLRWVAPSAMFWEMGIEAYPGRFFPASGSGNRIGSLALFTHIGDDIGLYQSWQLGASYLHTKPNQRVAILPGLVSDEGHGHDHEDEHRHHNDFDFTGQGNTFGLDAVWKWAPTGNAQNQQFTVQGEIFTRHENGRLGIGGETGEVQMHQHGAYIQTVYLFRPKWRVGLRYDRLGSHNHADSHEILHEANLEAHGYHPHQATIMLDYSPSEFSRIRLQHNRDHSSERLNRIVMLQFIVSLGAHGAHAY